MSQLLLLTLEFYHLHHQLNPDLVMAVTHFLQGPLKKYQELKESYQKKSPKQKWETIYNIGSVLCSLIGIRVYSDMKNRWYSYGCIVMIFEYLFLVFYTMWYYFKQGEFLKGIECTYTAGTVSLMFMMFWNGVGPKRFKFNNILSFGGKYIYKNHEVRTKHDTLCEKMVVELAQSFVAISIIICVVHLTLIAVPLNMITFTNTHVSIIRIEIPFFESDRSANGYMINVSMQIACILNSMIGLILVGTAALLIYNNNAVIPEIIHLDLEDLEDELNTNGFSLIAKYRLRDIFMKVLDSIGSVTIFLNNIFDKNQPF